MNVVRDLKVGIFVLAGLVLAGVVIFLIGDERRLFSSSVQFRAHFRDVQGLKTGAPIRMGGIDIGHVDGVGYGNDPKDSVIYVRLDVVKSEATRIKTDSVARITTKGLLGDKMVEITMGKAAESVPPGTEVKAEEPQDMLGRVSGMAEDAEAAMKNVKRVSESLADDKLQNDLHEGIAALNTVLGQVAHGDGYPHRLLTDKEEADRISRTVQNLERASNELAVTLVEVREGVARVKQGPGFAHDVLYGEGPRKEVEAIGVAANEVAATLKGVREGNGLARDLLYGGKGEGADAIANVAAMTGDLRAIVRDVRAGKGTVGALLVDPSVYEDMKSVLGNVQRNDVLRALVRYSIRQDEKRVVPKP
jgi:phospholipid/cholesterol/gamma-HCH transport system substrate-binding protein